MNTRQKITISLFLKFRPTLERFRRWYDRQLRRLDFLSASELAYRLQHVYRSRMTYEKWIRLRKLRPVEECSHKKGGQTRRIFNADYDLSYFVYVNGSGRIRCNSCGKKWYPGDPDWSEMAKKVSEETTNTTASSEQPSAGYNIDGAKPSDPNFKINREWSTKDGFNH